MHLQDAGRPRIIVTGFGPFGRFSENSSEHVIHALPSHPAAGKYVAAAVVLPVELERSFLELADLLASVEHDAVVSFGLADDDALRLERVARNRNGASVADAAGVVLVPFVKSLAVGPYQRLTQALGGREAAEGGGSRSEGGAAAPPLGRLGPPARCAAARSPKDCQKSHVRASRTTGDFWRAVRCGAIAPDAPETIASRLPLESIALRLASSDVPHWFSDDAGDYVCNNLFFRLLHEHPSDTTPRGLVHIPPLERWPAARLVDAAALIVVAVAEAITAAGEPTSDAELLLGRRS